MKIPKIIKDHQLELGYTVMLIVFVILHFTTISTMNNIYEDNVKIAKEAIAFVNERCQYIDAQEWYNNMDWDNLNWSFKNESDSN